MKKISIFVLICLIILPGIRVRCCYAAKEHLTILNYSDLDYPRFRFAYSKFKELHPNVDFQIEEKNTSDYFLELLTGSSNADIVFLYHKQLLENARAGTLLAMDKIPSLAKELHKNKWLPFFPLVSFQGHIYGFPDSIFSSLYAMNNEAAKACHFSLPTYPYTWRDIYIAARDVDWSQNNEYCLLKTNLSNPSFIMDYLSWQYSTKNSINLLTDEFKDALISFKGLVQIGAIEDSRFSSARQAIFLSPQNDFFPPLKKPVIGDCPAVTVNVNSFAIPKSAKNKDLAIDFMQIYMTKECQSAEYAYPEYMLLQDSSVYQSPEIDGLHLKPSDEMRQFVANNWCLRFSEKAFIHFLTDTQLVEKYLLGEASPNLSEILSLMQSKAELIIKE